MGNRIAKHVYNNQTLMLEKSTYYILDAQGNQLSMYEHQVDPLNSATMYYLTGRNIYGSSRLGTINDTLNMFIPDNLPSYGIVGNRNYELSNHLGNVLMVINDIIYPLSADNTTIDSYEVGISNIFDYSPFGAPLDGRTIQNEMYSLIEKCYDSIALDTAYLIDCDFQNGGCGWTSKNCPQALNCNYSTGVCKLILFKCSRIGKFPPYIKTPQDNEVTHNYTKTSGTTYFYEFEFDFGLGSCGSIDSVIFFEGGNFDYIQHITSSGHYSGNFTVTGSGSSKVGFYLAGGGDCQSTIDNFKLYTIDTLGVVENCTSNLVVEIGGYRYGFNSMERDDEIKGQGNSYDFGARMYDSRVGRWLSVDPLTEKYPDISPYVFVANSVLQYIDPDGKVILDPQTGKEVRKVDGEWKSVENIKEDGTIIYGDVSDKFNDNSRPFLEAMEATEVGRADINTLMNIPTRVTIDSDAEVEKERENANSTVKYGKLIKVKIEGETKKYFDEALIVPDIDIMKGKANEKGIDYDQQINSVMAVEVNHLENAESVIAFKKGKISFAERYEGALNKAIKAGLQYKDTKKQTIDKTDFDAIKNYEGSHGVKLDKDNQKEYDKLK